MAKSQSLVVVLVAMAANIALAVLKFVGFLVTGSPSMLAETYHSVSDTGNQVLLLVGMYYSRRKADQEHPFGYGKATFFYAFLVAVLLFGIAGWESLKHGIEAVRIGSPVMTGTVTVRGVTFPAVYINYAVLLATILFDGVSYLKAHEALSAEIRERGWRGFPEAFKRTSDMPVLAILIENAVAGLGAFIALVAIFLSQVTGNPMFDALGAVLIGLLLMTFAVALGWENKQLLLGEALTRTDERTLEDTIAEWDGIVEVADFRTVYFGADSVLLTADVAFEKDLDTETIDRRISAIEEELKRLEPLITKVYIEPEIQQSDRADT